MLGRQQVGFALIGASAMAIHGVSRATLDIDLLVTDARVLSASFWEGLRLSVAPDIRAGDADDPLAGVVRLCADGDRDVDVVVGRGEWNAEVIVRADAATFGGVIVPAVRPADLILLKLYAGGSQDRWDIEQLLAGPDRVELVREVETRLPLLPARSTRLWRTLRPAAGG